LQVSGCSSIRLLVGCDNVSGFEESGNFLGGFRFKKAHYSVTPPVLFLYRKGAPAEKQIKSIKPQT
jgi:uncharacterized protein YdhG (YjbR/CyaY superfamily)